MKSIILTSLIISIFLIGSVSAFSVDFFYSKTCHHCEAIYPTVINHMNYYTNYKFNLLEVSEQKNNELFNKEGFTGVPAFKIITDDCREIKFTGNNPKKLKCELQQMSSKECMTYPEQKKEGSWFIE